MISCTARWVLRVASYCRDAINELGLEENIGIVEHAVFERDYDELGMFEVGFNHLTDVLGV